VASAVTWRDYPPEKLLEERFHISEGFHPGQRDIIEQLVQGKRLLVIQRTGWGKSLCYQMASLYYPHLTIVFSPLKALMRDQCRRCNIVYNIPSAIVSSEFSPEENKETLAQAIQGRFNILFIAPERLDNADWQKAVRKMRISMIVIDEAHCISMWGHDFRPHYQRIVHLISALPDTVPVLALTATANRRVEDDVLEQIGSARVIRNSMYRPNLYLNVVKVIGDWEKLCYLGEVLSHRTDTGIVYAATRNTAVMVATFLQQLGLKAEYYHAEREESSRRLIEQKFMMNHYNVICSTNALGMGIDKPDIRFVIHYQLPASPIHYYQEIGRAGRDGNTAYCILLYDPADVSIQEHLINRDKAKKQNLEGVLLHKRQELDDMRNYAQTGGCYMECLTGYFGNETGYACGVCGNCRQENFPQVSFRERIQSATNYFMEEGILPSIEKAGGDGYIAHEAGWSLSYHGWSRIGKLVRASKYENGGPFALSLVMRAAEVARTRYPVSFDGVVSVPPTKSGTLVEMFARQVAGMLRIEYLPVIAKIRTTQEQKIPDTPEEKAENVKHAFAITFPQLVAGRNLLLIDDIYDSGCTLHEIGETLMRAGARAVYPLTLTRTLHSGGV
jgi:RecQ family ATP-dependent DNA helicase